MGGHSTATDAPTASSSFCSFSASSFDTSALTTWGMDSTNFLACRKRKYDFKLKLSEFHWGPYGYNKCNPNNHDVICYYLIINIIDQLMSFYFIEFFLKSMM